MPLVPKVVAASPSPERTARLVKDFSDAPYSGGSEVEEKIAFGDILLFSASNRTQGNELWRSDGTPEGTWLLKDIEVEQGGSSSPSDFILAGDYLYFEANNQFYGWSFWRTDGTTAGTEFVANLSPRATAVLREDLYLLTEQEDQYTLHRVSPDGHVTLVTVFPGEYNNEKLAVCGDRLCMFLSSTEEGWDFWTSDGTAEGTELVVEDLTNSLQYVYAMNDRLLVFRYDEAYGRKPWICNPTTGELTLLGDLITGYSLSGPSDPFLFNGQIYFWARTSPDWNIGLWVTDGTPESTTVIKTFAEDDDPETRHVAILGNKFHFTSRAGHLWESDGTSDGTSPAVSKENLTDLDDLLVYDGLLYFSASSPGYGNEIWRSDGTAEGTYLLKNIAPGDQHGSPGDFTVAAGKLFFEANNQTQGRELWVTEGAAESTRMVKDIAGGTESSEPMVQHSADSSSLLYVTTRIGYKRSELWAWDWVQCSAEQLADFGEPDRATSFMQLGSNTYFLAPREDSLSFPTLWISDGTADGTQPVDDNFLVQAAAPLDGKIYLGAFLYIEDSWQSWDNEMYRHTPGTGTIEFFREFNPDDDSHFEFYGELGSRLLFAAFAPDVGYEMFQINGTAEETAVVRDIEQGPDGGVDPSDGRAFVDGILYFSAYTSTHGSELWRTDGTEAGTWLVKDIVPGSESSLVEDITGASSLIYFYADDRIHGRELWVSDGSAAGTRMIRDITPGPEDIFPPAPIAWGDHLLFSVNDGVHGQELWITDGTTEGTFLLKDIWPGPGSSFVREFALSLNGEHVYFTASHDSYGDELWQTDGTPEGTILLADVNPGPAPSNPSDIVEKGGFIYFAADSESYGRELFVVPAADTSQDPYINWIAAWPDLDLTRSARKHDLNHDGVSNGLVFLFGGESPLTNAAQLLPIVSLQENVESGTTQVVLSFRRNTAVPHEDFWVETSTDLSGFHKIVPGENGVTMREEPDYFDPGISRITVSVPCTDESMMVGRVCSALE